MSKASEAIIEVLQHINATPAKPVSLYEIGIPLIVGKRFSEDEVVKGLYWLEYSKIIELVPDNCLRLLKPLPSGVQDVSK